MDKDDKDVQTSLSGKIREAEKEIAKGLIKWKSKRTAKPPPDEDALDRGSERVVDQANTLLKNRGREVVKGFQKAKKEFLKAYRDDEDPED